MEVCKDRCNMDLLAWKSEHKREYAEFKRRISQIENGDLSVLEELLSLADNCIPSKEESLPYGLDSLLKDGMTISKNDLPQYAQSYLTDVANNWQNESDKENDVDDCDGDMCQMLLDDVMDTFASCTGYVEGFLSSLKEQCVQQNTLLYCFYCWITFDHGM